MREKQEKVRNCLHFNFSQFAMFYMANGDEVEKKKLEQQTFIFSFRKLFEREKCKIEKTISLLFSCQDENSFFKMK